MLFKILLIYVDKLYVKPDISPKNNIKHNILFELNVNLIASLNSLKYCLAVSFEYSSL